MRAMAVAILALLCFGATPAFADACYKKCGDTTGAGAGSGVGAGGGGTVVSETTPTADHNCTNESTWLDYYLGTVFVCAAGDWKQAKADSDLQEIVAAPSGVSCSDACLAADRRPTCEAATTFNVATGLTATCAVTAGRRICGCE